MGGARYVWETGAAVAKSLDRQIKGTVANPFRNLIFEGGGVNGIDDAGAAAIQARALELVDVKREEEEQQRLEAEEAERRATEAAAAEAAEAAEAAAAAAAAEEADPTEVEADSGESEGNPGGQE